VPHALPPREDREDFGEILEQAGQPKARQSPAAAAQTQAAPAVAPQPAGDAPGHPAGMANGSTVSLLARGFIRLLRGPVPPVPAEVSRRVDRVEQAGVLTQEPRS
jgi:hypothetical protein